MKGASGIGNGTAVRHVLQLEKEVGCVWWKNGKEVTGAGVTCGGVQSPAESQGLAFASPGCSMRPGSKTQHRISDILVFP